MGQRRRTRKIKKILLNDKNGNTTYENLWDTTKTMLIKKHTAINVDIKRRNTSYQ